MRILLKILLTGLLLVVLVAVGAEVVALHRSNLPDPAQAPPTVVVRKAAYANMPPKTVRAVPEPAVRAGQGAVVRTPKAVVRQQGNLTP